jgi:hypothetical protein
MTRNAPFAPLCQSRTLFLCRPSSRRDFAFKSQPLLYFELLVAQEICIWTKSPSRQNGHEKHKKARKKAKLDTCCNIATLPIFRAFLCFSWLPHIEDLFHVAAEQTPAEIDGRGFAPTPFDDESLGQ